MAKEKKFTSEVDRAGSKGGGKHSNYHFSVNMSKDEYDPCRQFMDLYGTSQKELWRRLILFFSALPLPGKELIMKAGNIPSPGMEEAYAAFLESWAKVIREGGIKDDALYAIRLPESSRPQKDR
jgi:hypothetical protein